MIWECIVNDDQVCIFNAANAIEANVIKGLLEGEGITVTLQGEHLSGAIGELPPTDLTIGLWIAKLKQPQAVTVIEQYLAAQKAKTTQGDWFCRRCGEQNSASFEICWQCQYDPHEDW